MGQAELLPQSDGQTNKQRMEKGKQRGGVGGGGGGGDGGAETDLLPQSEVYPKSQQPDRWTHKEFGPGKMGGRQIDLPQ